MRGFFKFFGDFEFELTKSVIGLKFSVDIMSRRIQVPQCRIVDLAGCIYLVAVYMR